MSRREQLERNLNVKKPRIALTDDSIAADEIADAREAEMRAAATADSDASAFSDEENTEPVKFERGTTQKGALCLWHRGYKFVKRRCTWFSCCQKTCQATVRLDDEQHLTGRLGSKEHNHCAVFAQQSADAGRAQIKRAIEVDPQLRPSQMRAQVRAGTADETFDQLGTNDALDRMVQRVKNKLVGNVNRANPLEIRFAPELLNKDAPSTPTMSSINDGMGRGHRWNLPITRPPKYNVDFWNVYDRAQAALERTNNAMESAHGQFARDLNHHPSLGAFLAAFVKDIDKQRDIAQAIRLGKIRNRRPKYVIKEQRVRNFGNSKKKKKMASTAIGVFSNIPSEKEQVDELRDFYKERGISVAKDSSTAVFDQLVALIDATTALVSGGQLSTEKEVELVLNSLFSLMISYKDEQALLLVQRFCALLNGVSADKQRIFKGHGWNSPSGVTVRLLSNLYHVHDDCPALQLIELKHLLVAAGHARLTNHLDIIAAGGGDAATERIDALVRRWKLDVTQCRELYRCLHAALVADERHESAAEVMCTLLKTYTPEDAPTAQEDARECVRTTIVDPKAFCFDHLLGLEAVNSLKKTDPLMFQMLGIFVYGSLADYRRFIADHPTFLREQLRVEDEQTLETKMKQLTLISLAEKAQHIPLTTLVKALDILDRDQLEEFIVDAIHANAIHGKINELDDQLMVSFYQQRVFQRAQWEQLHVRLGALLENARWFRDNMQSVVAVEE
ncbi:hypothetical protein niasHT_036484 [Heterodera trifolii]|uniref:PCI domain-containing protein n=1 Tax=Heterodera trifolii TaxID=157864 RepID=A0ABD2J6P7_9BILA